MSYDFNLRDPVTREVLKVDPHMMHGGNIPCTVVDGKLVPAASADAYINITYNYAPYYAEALPEEECIKNGWGREGARAVCGRSGAEAVPILDLMISRIKDRYCPGGEWQTRHVVRSEYVRKEDGIIALLESGDRMDELYETRTEEYDISEGSTEDYWEATAANALEGLYKLRALSLLRPDGVWTEDS